MSTTARVYPKINLFLEIIRRRDDGYHEIATVMQLIDNVYDELTIEPARELSLSVIDADLPDDTRNLVYQAAEKIRDTANIKTGAHFILRKKIPFGAGLGGGSADAAMALKMSNDFWRINLPPEKLLSLAAELGSDVPFFLRANFTVTPLAVVTGRGEIITPLNYSPVPVSLIVPTWTSETANAYRALATVSFNQHSLADFLPVLGNNAAREDSLKILDAGFNLFEKSFFQNEPRAKELAEFLSTQKFPARLSGSGSAMWLPKISAAERVELQLKFDAQPQFSGTRIY